MKKLFSLVSAVMPPQLSLVKPTGGFGCKQVETQQWMWTLQHLTHRQQKPRAGACCDLAGQSCIWPSVVEGPCNISTPCVYYFLCLLKSLYDETSFENTYFDKTGRNMQGLLLINVKRSLQTRFPRIPFLYFWHHTLLIPTGPMMLLQYSTITGPRQAHVWLDP